jgi:hypothetical protein
MKNRILIIIAILMFVPIILKAQEVKKKLPFEIGTDLMSRFVWRGQCVSKAPNIQPSLVYAPKFGLKVGAWGSYAFTGDYAEVDLFASYGIKGISITLTDYFVMNESAAENIFFDYKNESTGHLIEGALSYDGPENFPIKLTAGTMFYGADKKIDQMIVDTVLSDTTYTYKNAYSTYFEIAYTFRNISIFAGITPMEGLYGNKFGLVNFGLTGRKTLKITDHFSLPIQASLITNPQRQNIYLVFGFTF